MGAQDPKIPSPQQDIGLLIPSMCRQTNSVAEEADRVSGKLGVREDSVYLSVSPAFSKH